MGFSPPATFSLLRFSSTVATNQFPQPPIIELAGQSHLDKVFKNNAGKLVVVDFYEVHSYLHHFKMALH